MPQSICWPQLLGTSPHLPSQVVKKSSGRHPQRPCESTIRSPQQGLCRLGFCPALAHAAAVAPRHDHTPVTRAPPRAATTRRRVASLLSVFARRSNCSKSIDWLHSVPWRRALSAAGHDIAVASPAGNLTTRFRADLTGFAAEVRLVAVGATDRAVTWATPPTLLRRAADWVRRIFADAVIAIRWRAAARRLRRMAEADNLGTLQQRFAADRPGTEQVRAVLLAGSAQIFPSAQDHSRPSP